jgi:hypothetical protein
MPRSANLSVATSTRGAVVGAQAGANKGTVQREGELLMT